MQTITKLYDTYEEAAATVGDLERIGIPYAHISLIASDADNRMREGVTDGDDRAGRDASAGATAGVILGGGAGLLAGLGALAIPGVGPVVAAGWLTATLTGAVAGGAVGAAAGGIIGALTGSGVSREHAHVYVEGIRRGGAVVAVRTDDRWANVAREVLNRRPSADPDVRGAAYRASGWSEFDDTTPPYTPADSEQGVRPPASDR
jgi:hypothetical protein